MRVMRQELFQFSGRISIGQFCEDKLQVIEDLQVIEFGTFNQAVEIGSRNGAAGVAAEEPVFTANGKGPDAALCGIVVNIQHAVFGVANDLLPLI